MARSGRNPKYVPVETNWILPFYFLVELKRIRQPMFVYKLCQKRDQPPQGVLPAAPV